MSREQEARREDVDGAEPAAPVVGKRSLVASRYPALAQALGDRGSGEGDQPTIHDAATAAVEHKGSGVAVDPGVAARVGAHLGADFSGVRVHSDPLAQQATAAMGARAFAHGGDVFLGPGESGGDLSLMAHELTHVVQQGAAGQRGIQRRVQVGDADSPAEREADQVSAAVTGGGRPASLLVDDGPVGPGQMLKSQFLEQLRAEVTAAADDELGPVYSPIGCPYIEQYFGRYAGQPASAGEALLRRFAPATRTAGTAADMIPAVVARVREGVRAWRETGEAPPDLAAMAPAVPAGGEGRAAQAQLLRAPDGSETLTSLEAELGPGQALDGGTASRMSEALGIDVSAARIHIGSVAARKAADAGALAFAVGSNIVMGAGAPRAGTPEGDALLAHELAHTTQQAGAASDPAARRRPIGAESAAAEEHADAAAAGALAQLHGGAGGGLVQRLGGALKTGLQLQRCKTEQNESTFAAMNPDEIEAMHRMRTHVAAAERLLEEGALSEADRGDLRAKISAARAAIARYAELRERGTTTMFIIAGTRAGAAAIVADDATGIGAADDVLLIPIALIAIGAAIFGNSRPSADELSEAWQSVGRTIDNLGRGLEVLMAANVGEKVRSLTGQVAIHLARYLGETVGGMPPDHQNDPGRDRPHWWKEIKNFLQQIKNQGLSDKQLARELAKKFTPEQLAQIREALRRVAEKTGEQPPFAF